ncbi:unnamed protein product [Allacma fusca]|uniref:Male-enhanced antigen 1 n=1 Tax=Allacma fusca TaxID=39272 RepID=A0A8J2LDX9_9HEXA|nr:unnamed protein product [Allacma fusca]
MSPDPPRNDTHDDELIDNTGVYFMPIPDDDDFMADGNEVHQLDYDTHDDSDFSDDGDERQQQGSHNPENNNSNEPVTRMMAHYQLLIPFPQSEIIEPSSSDETSEPAETEPAGVEPIEEAGIEAEGTTNNKKLEEIDNREIHLSDDNMEIIKNAMKGFSLPASNIPTWADQIDETSWKEKLVSSFGRKSSGSHSPPKSASNASTK